MEQIEDDISVFETDEALSAEQVASLEDVGKELKKSSQSPAPSADIAAASAQRDWTFRTC